LMIFNRNLTYTLQILALVEFRYEVYIPNFTSMFVANRVLRP
jgi:hypothetical protein